MHSQIMNSSRALAVAPSFNWYSSSRLTEIAARVVEEFRDEYAGEDHLGDGGSPFESGESFPENYGSEFRPAEKEERGREEDEEFEFAVVGNDYASSPAPADEIFSNGQIRPSFPLFNTDLVFGSDGTAEFEKRKLSFGEAHQGAGAPPLPTKAARLSLRKLFYEDGEHHSSSSSSSSESADDLDGVSPDIYCVWKPKRVAAAEGKGKKSKSTGSGLSQRWSFRDLRRSISDVRRGSFVPSPHPSHENGSAKKPEEKPAKVEESSAVDGGWRRKQVFPDRRDLVGFMSNANFGRDLRPI